MDHFIGLAATLDCHKLHSFKLLLLLLTGQCGSGTDWKNCRWYAGTHNFVIPAVRCREGWDHIFLVLLNKLSFEQTFWRKRYKDTFGKVGDRMVVGRNLKIEIDN